MSFPTISGAGPNGAIVHYRALPETEKRLEPGSLYLLDSGAQYLDGTTDVTRTVAIGEPTAEMRDRFTRVLKGHIALALARFPKGTTGTQLDAFARRGLWQAGLDYDHGTGHGVGSYLGVHEGPQRISKAPSAQPLLPGMIVSNEPGYYKTGAYGIRIENLVLVQPAEANGGEREMMCFETLTLAPIDRNLVEPSLLDDEEIDWLDAYHAEVRETLTPLVDPDTGRMARRRDPTDPEPEVGRSAASRDQPRQRSGSRVLEHDPIEFAPSARRPRESGGPGQPHVACPWVPACAGMTVQCDRKPWLVSERPSPMLTHAAPRGEPLVPLPNSARRKSSSGRNAAGSTPSRQRALTLILSGSERGT